MTRIVVLGSLMQDLVVRAPRLPREGETLFGHDFAMSVGGKGGNQAIAAARLGAERVTMIGRVGDDAFADTILDTLRQANLNLAHVVRDGVSGTGVAIPIVLDNGANSILSVPRANLAMTVAQVEAARDEISSAAMLLLQLEVSAHGNVAAAEIARRAGVPVMLNAAPPSEPPPGLLASASILVVNEPEADALTPFTGDRLAQAQALRGLGPLVVIITLGAAGCVVASDALAARIGSFPVKVVDSVGAGDAFCGALAVALAKGRPLDDALPFASAAGGLAVTRRGASSSIPHLHEVENLLRHETISLP